jgi:hypothetical protein
LRSRQVAESFLTGRGYPEKLKALVLECIELHHTGGSDRSLKSILLRDTDALDFLGIVEILRDFSKNPRDLQKAYEETKRRWDLARVLAEMGRSIFALGNNSGAESIWCESLRLSIETQATLVGLEALVGIASLQAKRGNIEEALEFLLIVLDHPASLQGTRNRASQLRAQLETQLTSQEIENVHRRSGAKTFDLIAEDILRQTGNA